MALTNEMRRLTRHFLDAYDARTEAVAGIRTATAQELADFRATHDVMSAEQREQLSDYTDELRHDGCHAE